MADDDVGAPVTELLLHPTRSPANAGHGEARVRMVGQREKPRHKGLDVVVKPAFGCFGHPHHGGAARFCVAWHARKRVDHFHVVVEVPQQMDVVLHEDATRSVVRNGVEQRDDEDANEQPSSVECLMNLSEVVRHTGTVVEQTRAHDLSLIHI